MAIGKPVNEFIQTIAEEAPKRAPRRKAKEFETPEDFTQGRVEDIARDEAATYAEQAKQQAKIDEVKARETQEVERTPFPDRETFIREEQLQAKAETRAEADALRLQQLQEKQRDLYLKANDLKIERDTARLIQEQKPEGRTAFNVLMDRISQTPGVGKTFSNIEARTEAIYKRINSEMFELKEGMRTKWLGIRQDTELANEVIRYLKDGAVKNKARAKEVELIAKQWEGAATKIKNLRNKAGARIGRLEDWILPQSHDAMKIRKAGKEEWKKRITPKLDKARIEKEQGASLDDVLDKAYVNITSPRVETSGVKGTGKMAKRGEESRVLHFKNANDMITYKDEFGNPDVFATMDAHIRQQSNEIATMQLFGSNPEATFNKLKELARNEGMGSNAESHLDQNWRLSTGQVDGDDIVSKLDGWIATVGGTHRAISVAGKLGSAMVSSLADVSSIVMGSGYRGISSVNILGKALHTLLQEATTIGKVADNVRVANRIGVVSEFASASLANSRYAEVGAGAAQRAAETVIRASGLGSYTNSMRAAMGLELAGNFAENFSKKMDDTPFSGLLKEYGITADEWDMIRKTETYKAKGAEFMDTNKIYEVDEQLGYKVNEMITNEMDAFVIMPTNRTRIWTTWGEKKGTFKGEMARNMMLFKSFPIASTLMHFKRIGRIDGNAGKLAYGAKLIGVNTVMGGITLWAYDVATGKTPRTVDRPAFIGEALTKSGGLGIFGDFFLGLADNVYGHSFSETLVGVPASTLDDIVDTAQDLLTKEGEDKYKNVYNRAKAYIPGQNLWYTRYAVEKTLGEFMGEMLDPDYEARKRRRQKAMRLRGQKELIED